MNKLSILQFVLFFSCTCLFMACEEEELFPREHVADFVKEFPEGSNPWDQDLEEIAERFGVKCIYDNLTSADITKVWTASKTGKLTAEGLPKDSVRLKKLYTRFFKEQIFPYLNPTYAKAVLPNYIYFSYRYLLEKTAINTITGEQVVYYEHVEMNYDGLGFWVFCWSTGEFLGYYGLMQQDVQMFTKALDVEKKREILLKNIFRKMVEEEVIAIPEEFESGHEFDYTTQIISRDVVPSHVDYPNYYKRRGFPEQLRNYKNYASSSNLYNITSTSPLENFCDYLWLAFRYTAEEIEQNYKDFPLVVKYYYFTVDYVKDNYGMDISRIAEPVTEDLDSNL